MNFARVAQQDITAAEIALGGVILFSGSHVYGLLQYFRAALLQGLRTESAATHSMFSTRLMPMLQLLNQLKALKWHASTGTHGTTCGGP